MKIYITFGQSHVHNINGRTFDKDCVAVINSDSHEKGIEKAFEVFDEEFCFFYTEDSFDMKLMINFPRGFVELI